MKYRASFFFDSEFSHALNFGERAASFKLMGMSR